MSPRPSNLSNDVPSKVKVMARPRDTTPPLTWQQVDRSNRLDEGTEPAPPAPKKKRTT